MVPSDTRSLAGKLLVAVLLLLTPVVAFFLISSALTADAGLARWLLTVVAPLALLGSGIYLIARGAWDGDSSGSRGDAA